jgi:hypothetical protein
VILDRNGRELRGYLPTEFGRRSFGPDVDQTEVRDASINRRSSKG